MILTIILIFVATIFIFTAIFITIIITIMLSQINSYQPNPIK